MENITHSQVFEFSKTIDYANGSIVSKQFVKKNSGTITLFAFDKGQSLSEHVAPFDALIQVMEGIGDIYINKTKYKVKAGQSIIMPANIPHAVNAPEKFKMLVTMIKEV